MTVPMKKRIWMHIFEHTLLLPKDEKLCAFFPPLQCILGVKQVANGRLRSHQWFFEGFAEITNPEVVMVLAPGTCPSSDALVELMGSLDNDPSKGMVYSGSQRYGHFSPSFLVTPQELEYLILNDVDRAAESLWATCQCLHMTAPCLQLATTC